MMRTSVIFIRFPSRRICDVATVPIRPQTGRMTFAIEVPEGLVTPTVVVDINIVERNITTWAARFAERGVGLRPHTKTSKCLPIIERQVAAGVVGLTVATLGEAEVLADAGFTDLFQAYPVWAGHLAQARRLRDLHERVDFKVGVESIESAEALGAAVRGSGRALPVVVEIESGMLRTGVAAANAVAVARAAEHAGLEVRGVFTYGGHAYGSCEAPAAAADDEVRCLEEALDHLTRAGFAPTIVSAGSTPTALRSTRPPITDERPGVYVFHDAQQVGVTWPPAGVSRRRGAVTVRAPRRRVDNGRATIGRRGGGAGSEPLLHGGEPRRHPYCRTRRSRGRHLARRQSRP
jgi:D-serine deaminase-like pyridoxal phosphate-dependent protein